MSAAPLHDLLARRGDEVMTRWIRAVTALHPESLRRLELVNDLPGFVEALAGALVGSAAGDGGGAAESHGLQRLGLGFSLDAVVREYGVLHECIVGLASDHGAALGPIERRVLFETVIEGIARAVAQYARHRDAEVQRAANTHFAFVAHELRGQLQSARLAMTALARADSPQRSERARKALERALESLHDRIEGSLSDARLGSGADLSLEPVALAQVLADCAADVELAASSKSVRVELECDTGEPVRVDRRLFHSAVGNLVGNAVKFTHEGGLVHVRARRTAALVTIEVEDECGGLPSGMVEAAFAPFVQMGARDSRGFGLGLAIARQVVSAHRGTLRVQDLPGKGCLFVMELPLSA